MGKGHEKTEFDIKKLIVLRAKTPENKSNTVK